MSMLRPLALFAVLAAGSFALADDEPAPEAADALAEAAADSEPAEAELTLATYNLGLAHGAVALAAERRPQILDALGELDADVLCLQEVWWEEDAAAVLEALGETYPHHIREITADDSEATTPCGIFPTLKLSKCVTKKCEANGISAEECVSTEPCQERYDALADDCKRCLAANTASPSSCALGGAQEFAWSGLNGLMLLSRKPLEDAKFDAFDTLLVKRGVISAQVDGVQVMCTHLSADLGVVPYPPERAVASWSEEHAAQVQWMADHADPDACTVLLGDLNTGPSDGGFTGELSSSWELLPEAGFSEPWDAPLCTWCQDNPLAGSEVDKLIDHALFHSCPEGLELEYSRIMDQPITIEGVAEPTRLSDHYGLAVAIADTTPEPAGLTISSTDFAPGEPIPAVFTCEGEDRSPALAWQGVPEGTQALALIVEDPDAPDPEDPKTTWTHWVLYDLPPTAEGLAQAIAELPEGTRQGHNDWGEPGYKGPCPPVGEHRYFHKLYALSAPIGDQGALDRAGLLAAMEGLVLAEASTMGTYVKAENRQ